MAVQESGGQAKASDALKIGICGLGRAGWGMIQQEVKGLPQIRIVAGCDILKERAEKLAAAHGAAAYSDFKKFLKDPNTELVVIATRSIDHGPMTIKALKAGKNVLVEKPMAMNAREAGRMIATAKECGRVLLVRHNRRFDPEFIHVREIIASGKLGEVFLIQMRQLGYQRRNDWQTLKQYGGGLLFNWGPHLVDCAMRLLGGPEASVWSDLRRVAAVGDAEDHVKIVIKGRNGMVLDMEVSGGVAITQPNWQVCGQYGALQVDGGKCRLKYLDPSALQKIEPISDTPADGAGFSNPETLQWIEEQFPIAPKQKLSFWDEVYKAAKCGGQFPVTLEEAQDNMRIIDLARKGTGF